MLAGDSGIESLFGNMDSLRTKIIIIINIKYIREIYGLQLNNKLKEWSLTTLLEMIAYKREIFQCIFEGTIEQEVEEVVAKLQEW